jgi:hypothetical protein
VGFIRAANGNIVRYPSHCMVHSVDFREKYVEYIQTFKFVISLINTYFEVFSSIRKHLQMHVFIFVTF